MVCYRFAKEVNTEKNKKTFVFSSNIGNGRSDVVAKGLSEWIVLSM